MQKDLSKYKILGKFSIVQFMLLIGASALVVSYLLNT